MLAIIDGSTTTTHDISRRWVSHAKRPTVTVRTQLAYRAGRWKSLYGWWELVDTPISRAQRSTKTCDRRSMIYRRHRYIALGYEMNLDKWLTDCRADNSGLVSNCQPLQPRRPWYAYLPFADDARTELKRAAEITSEKQNRPLRRARTTTTIGVIMCAASTVDSRMVPATISRSFF